jgi:hypothetical protein
MTDDDNRVRFIAMSSAGKYLDRAQIKLLLVDRISADKDKANRRVAMSLLSELFREDATRQVLMEQARQDEAKELRLLAVSLVMEKFDNWTGLLSFLSERAKHDSEKEIRRDIVWKIIAHYREDEQTFHLLCNRAVKDPSPESEDMGYEHENYVRDTALNHLASDWSGRTETRRILQERAENDPTLWLRERAKKLLSNLPKQPDEQLTGGG